MKAEFVVKFDPLGKLFILDDPSAIEEENLALQFKDLRSQGKSRLRKFTHPSMKVGGQTSNSKDPILFFTKTPVWPLLRPKFFAIANAGHTVVTNLGKTDRATKFNELPNNRLGKISYFAASANEIENALSTGSALSGRLVIFHSTPTINSGESYKERTVASFSNSRILDAVSHELAKRNWSSSKTNVQESNTLGGDLYSSPSQGVHNQNGNSAASSNAADDDDFFRNL
jgi:hypothetical protein